MAAKKIAVDLYYDVISPYSWIGFELLCRYRNEWNSMALRLKPFLLGAVMKASQNRPPMMVPNKGFYMFKDLDRLKNYYAIPITVPTDFMEIATVKTTLNAQRFVTAIDMISDGKYTEEISRQLWKRIFTSHKDVTLAESFRETGNDAKVPNDIVEKAIVEMGHEQVKDKLKAVTNEAVAYGTFGAPTIVVHLPSGPEMVWGSDRIEIVGSLMGEKYIGPLKKYSQL